MGASRTPLWLKSLGSYRVILALVGELLALYLRLVYVTTRWTCLPDDALERLPQTFPQITAMWHGQHFMIPFLKPKGLPVAVMISHHRDGEINARAVQRFGFLAIRGAGSQSGKDKGGAKALRQLLQLLKQNINVGMTADVPKVSRVAGLGIVKLAQLSGRPIVPVAVVKKHFYQFSSWDRAVIGLPFGPGVLAVGEPVFVPRDADDATCEALRLRVQDDLNDLHERAYAQLGLAFTSS